MKPARTVLLARALLKPSAATESATGMKGVSGEELQEALERRLMAGSGGSQPLAPAAATVAATGIRSHARHAIETVEQGCDPESLPILELASLEAIVLTVGRPALRYQNGRVDKPVNIGPNEKWSLLVNMSRLSIEAVSSSVGRIDLEPPGAMVEHLGTGWRLGDRLLVTNRHVAKQFVIDATQPPEQWVLDASMPLVVEFAAFPGAVTSVRVPITGLVHCPNAGADIAILDLAPGLDLPAGLTLETSADLIGHTKDRDGVAEFQGEDVYLIGHPWEQDLAAPAQEVFEVADGSKRLSPGSVTAIESENPVFEHDCSTLGGNSGSCVVSTQLHTVVGLHYAGRGVRLNQTARANAAVALVRLKGTRAGDLLFSGHP